MADFDRAALVEYGKKLVDAGLTKGTGGNLSLFDRERGLMAITPSGIDFHDIRESDIVVMDSEGEVVEGARRRVSGRCTLRPTWRARTSMR